jgi:hypothetical protein
MGVGAKLRTNYGPHTTTAELSDLNGQPWPPASSGSRSTTVEPDLGVKGSRVQNLGSPTNAKSDIAPSQVSNQLAADPALDERCLLTVSRPRQRSISATWRPATSPIRSAVVAKIITQSQSAARLSSRQAVIP